MSIVSAVALAVFVLAACSDGSQIEYADFSSRQGWTINQGSDAVFTDGYLDIDATQHHAELGQAFNLRRNSYYVVSVQYRFTGGAGTRPEVIMAAGSVVGPRNLRAGDDWTEQRLFFFSGDYTDANFRLEVRAAGAGAAADGVVRLRRFEVRRIARSEAMGNNALPLDRHIGNLIQTNWRAAAEAGQNPSDWTAVGDNLNFQTVRDDGGMLYHISLSFTNNALGSGYIYSRIPVRRGRHYRLTFNYSLPANITGNPHTDDDRFAGRTFGLFASLRGHQSDILAHGRQTGTTDRFNYTRSRGANFWAAEPIYFYAHRDRLDITVNLGFPGGGEARGTALIRNIILEEVDVTSMPDNPFFQSDGSSRPTGEIVAVTLLIVLAMVAAAGIFIGCYIYLRKKSQKSKE